MYKMSLALGMLIFSTFIHAQESDNPTTNETSGYGNNIVSFAPISVNNKGLSLGFSYERFLGENGKFSIYIPVLYNYHKPEYHERYKYSEKNLGIYLGFKYYTAGSHGPVKYALGALFGHLNTDRHTVETIYPGQGHGNIPLDQHLNQTITGFMFHNSLNVFIAKKFTYILEVNAGLGQQSGYDDATIYPMVLLQMSIGYRF